MRETKQDQQISIHDQINQIHLSTRCHSHHRSASDPRSDIRAHFGNHGRRFLLPHLHHHASGISLEDVPWTNNEARADHGLDIDCGQHCVRDRWNCLGVSAQVSVYFAGSGLLLPWMINQHNAIPWPRQLQLLN